MNKIVALSANERKGLFKETAKIKKIPEILIERNIISEPIKVPGSKIVNYLVNPKAQRKTDDKA